MGVKLSDCTPELRKRLECALARQWHADGKGIGVAPENAAGEELAAKRKPRGPSRGPNKTEMRFNLEVLGGRGVFEGKSYALPGGGRYKPDFLTREDGVDVAWEVKGSYRFPSESGAVRGFLAARAAWPETRFRWFARTNDGWEERHLQNNPKVSHDGDGGRS